MAQAAIRDGIDVQDKKVSDPFYSEENLNYVKKSVQELCAGKGKAHELIETEDE